MLLGTAVRAQGQGLALGLCAGFRRAFSSSASSFLDHKVTEYYVRVTTASDQQPYVFLRGASRACGAQSSIDVSDGRVPWDSLRPVSAFTGRRVHGAGHGASAETRVVVIREPFVSSTQPETPLDALFRRVEGNTVVLDPACVEGSRLQLADVYDSHGAITSTQSTELQGLLRSLGFDLSFEGAVDTSSHAQSTNEVLMVAPTAFEFNTVTAEDNYFMSSDAGGDGGDGGGEGAGSSKEGSRRRVLREYAGLYDTLANKVGLNVHLFQHQESHGTPDAVFPNNWFTTHGASELGSGSRTLALYPLKSPNRRLERRQDIVDYIQTIKPFDRVVDFSEYEDRATFLEGTGCLVLDRQNKVAYVALSERCHLSLAEQWAEQMGYDRLVPYRSLDAQNHPVYHTNVVMSVGTGVAVICADSVTEGSGALMDSLSRTHEVVAITWPQVQAFAGNILEVVDARGLPAMVMSTQAYRAFTDEQKRVIERHCPGGLHHAPVDTLERIGGGGVRCCIAELF